jgi:hypothetical protein
MAAMWLAFNGLGEAEKKACTDDLAQAWCEMYCYWLMREKGF